MCCNAKATAVIENALECAHRDFTLAQSVWQIDKAQSEIDILSKVLSELKVVASL